MRLLTHNETILLVMGVVEREKDTDRQRDRQPDRKGGRQRLGKDRE